MVRAYFLRSGHVFRQKLTAFKIHYYSPKKLFRLVRAYFMRSGHVFRQYLTAFKFTTIVSKTFLFGQGLFSEVGTRFSSKIDGFQNSILRSKKTFSFGLGLFFEVGTRFLSKIDGFQNSHLWSKKLSILCRWGYF